MKPLTKEQAIEISFLHFQYADEHPDATREELQQAFYKIKAQVLSKSTPETRLEAVFKPVETR